MAESDPTGTDDRPLEEEKFEDLTSSEEEEERPELDIPFNERKLLTHPLGRVRELLVPERQRQSRS